MSKPARRVLPVGVTAAGLTAFGGILSGTACAAPFAGNKNSYPDCEPIHPERNSQPGYNAPL